MRGSGRAKFEGREARLLERAKGHLALVSTGANEATLFKAIARCASAAGGILTTITPSAPTSMRSHGLGVAPELVEGWMRTPEHLLAEALVPVVQARDGGFWREVDTGIRDLRGQMEVMDQLDRLGLGEGAGYKVLSRPVGASRVEHVFFALLTERRVAFSERTPDLLAALNPAVRAAFLRLRLPLGPSSSIFGQIAEDDVLGYACLAPSGALRESNRRAHELAARYGARAGIGTGRRMLVDLVECARERGAMRVVRADGGAFLEIRRHVLAKETHAVSEDVHLFVFQEWEDTLMGLPLPRLDLDRAVEQMTPVQREVAVLLGTTRMTSKEIADALSRSRSPGIGFRTVETHARSIYAGLGFRRRPGEPSPRARLTGLFARV
jgi:DNA-binding CsgD family transcriptional regulator